MSSSPDIVGKVRADAGAQSRLPKNDLEVKIREDNVREDVVRENIVQEDDEPVTDEGGGTDVDDEEDGKEKRDVPEIDPDTILSAITRGSEELVGWDKKSVLINYPIYYVRMKFDGNKGEEIKKLKDTLDGHDVFKHCTPLIVRDNNEPAGLHDKVRLWVYGYDVSSKEARLFELSNTDDPSLRQIEFKETVQMLTSGDLFYYDVDHWNGDDNETRGGVEIYLHDAFERVCNEANIFIIRDNQSNLWTFKQEAGSKIPEMKALAKGLYSVFRDKFDNPTKPFKAKGSYRYYHVVGAQYTFSMLHEVITKLSIVPKELSYEGVYGGNSKEVDGKADYENWAGMKIQGVFALYRRNPLIESILWSYIIRSSLMQFFKGYRELLPQAMPYFVLSGTVGGFIGYKLGEKALESPNVLWELDRKSTGVRLLWGIRDGMIVFIGINLAAIAIDLALHPEDAEVSNEVFFSTIEPWPIIGGLATILWKTISPYTKDKKLAPVLEAILESASELVLHQSIWSTFLRETCEFPLRESAEYGTIAAAGSMAAKGVLACFKREYSASPHTLLLYCYGINALYDQFETFTPSPRRKEQVSNWDLYYWMMVAQTITLALQCIGACRIILRHRLKFMGDFMGDTDITSRLITQKTLSQRVEARERQMARNKTLTELLKSYELYFFKIKQLPGKDQVPPIPRDAGNKNKIIILLVGEKYYACFYIKTYWKLEPLPSSASAKESGYQLIRVDVTDFIRYAQKSYAGKMTFPTPHDTTAAGRYKRYNGVSLDGKIKINSDNAFVVSEFIEKALNQADLLQEQDAAPPTPDAHAMELRKRRVSGEDGLERKVRGDVESTESGLATPILTAFHQQQQLLQAQQRQHPQQPQPQQPQQKGQAQPSPHTIADPSGESNSSGGRNGCCSERMGWCSIV